MVEKLNFISKSSAALASNRREKITLTLIADWKQVTRYLKKPTQQIQLLEKIRDIPKMKNYARFLFTAKNGKAVTALFLLFPFYHSICKSLLLSISDT